MTKIDSDAWRTALAAVLEITHGAMERDFGGRSCLIGSAATALQGIDVVPRDLDILAKEPGAVFGFAELMAGFAPETNLHPDNMEKWLSSAREPVKADEPDPEKFVWHFGRWLVGGVKVEVAHIVPPTGMVRDDGIWEAGPAIWPHVKSVRFLEWDVPVVPLEIQLQTSLSRKLDDRVDEIIRHFRTKGYDVELLDSALSEANMKIFKGVVNSE